MVYMTKFGEVNLHSPINVYGTVSHSETFSPLEIPKVSEQTVLYLSPNKQN